MAEIVKEIARLREHGFQVLPLPIPLRRIGGIYLHRFTRDGHIDTVLIRADSFTVAARLRNKFDPREPIAETRAVWSQHGVLTEVIDGFLRRYYCQDAEATASRFLPEIDALRMA